MLSSLFGTPVAHAAGLNDLIKFANDTVLSVIPIVIALAILLFIWGLALFIYKSDSEDGRKEGRNRMIWGVIALFVIVSVWGIVRFLGNTVGINENDNNTPRLPQIPTSSKK